MIYDEFNAYCAALPGTTYLQQWGGAHVWKVGGKVFAIGGWADDGVGIIFKANPVAFEMLRDAPGFRPAPYMASRGLLWIQYNNPSASCNEEVLDYVRTSYELVHANLTKRQKAEIEGS